MRSLFLAMIGGVCFVNLTACQQIAPSDSTPTKPSSANAGYGARVQSAIISEAGTKLGEVTVWQGQKGILFEIRADSLPTGSHGLHLHGVGTCDDIGVFKNSGGHVSNDTSSHGFLHPGGVHQGDLPNIYVEETGSIRSDIFSTFLTIDDLLDADGSALVIHASRDDYQSFPIGGAGARIACAAFNSKSN